MRLHTHYDPQSHVGCVVRYLDSPWCHHRGRGNCGFSIAPCHPDDHASSRRCSLGRGHGPRGVSTSAVGFRDSPSSSVTRRQAGGQLRCYSGIRRPPLRDGRCGIRARTSDDEIISMQAIVDDAMRGVRWVLVRTGHLTSTTPERPVPAGSPATGRSTRWSMWSVALASAPRDRALQHRRRARRPPTASG